MKNKHALSLMVTASMVASCQQIHMGNLATQPFTAAVTQQAIPPGDRHYETAPAGIKADDLSLQYDNVVSSSDEKGPDPDRFTDMADGNSVSIYHYEIKQKSSGSALRIDHSEWKKINSSESLQSGDNDRRLIGLSACNSPTVGGRHYSVQDYPAPQNPYCVAPPLVPTVNPCQGDAVCSRTYKWIDGGYIQDAYWNYKSYHLQMTEIMFGGPPNVVDIYKTYGLAYDLHNVPYATMYLCPVNPTQPGGPPGPPTPSPTASPSTAPSSTPTPSPTTAPTATPTVAPTATPTPPKPTPTATPPETLAISAHQVFSPYTGEAIDGDKKFGVNEVQIKASSRWTLYVRLNDGRLRALTDGYGNSTYPWNGRVRNLALEDGSYTLIVKSGSRSAAAPISIDRTPPKVTDAHVSKIEQDSFGGDLKYTIEFHAIDPSVKGVHTSVDLKRITLKGVNVPYTMLGSPVRTSGDDYAMQIQVGLSDTDKLDFTVIADDMVGNRATEPAYFSVNSLFAGSEIGDESNCKSNGASAYHIASTPVDPVVAAGGSVYPLERNLGRSALRERQGAALKSLIDVCTVPVSDLRDPANTPFYWAHDPRKFKYALGLGLANPFENGRVNRPLQRITLLSLAANVAIVGEDDQKVWYEEPKLITNTFGHGINVVWDGTRNGSVAPTGNYRVFVSYTHGDGQFMHRDSSPDSRQIWYDVRKKRPPGLRLSASEQNLVGFRIINNRDGKEFGSYGKFKTFIHAAGSDVPFRESQKAYEWHHIVEQQQDQFPKNKINSTRNIVRMPYDDHDVISGYYQRHDTNLKNNENGKLTVREWLKEYHGKDFEYQLKFGNDTIRNLRNEGEIHWTYESQSDQASVN